MPTEDGIKIITVLPDEIKSAQMTVDMENTLAEVAAGTVTDISYLNQIIDILLKGLKSKLKDSTYDAYFTPETIEDYNYTDKDNREHCGKQFKFKMGFLQKRKINRLIDILNSTLP